MRPASLWLIGSLKYVDCFKTAFFQIFLDSSGISRPRILISKSGASIVCCTWSIHRPRQWACSTPKTNALPCCWSYSMTSPDSSCPTCYCAPACFFFYCPALTGMLLHRLLYFLPWLRLDKKGVVTNYPRWSLSMVTPFQYSILLFY